VSEEETIFSNRSCEMEDHACLKDVGLEEDKYVKRTMSWLGDTSTNSEVHGILERVMQDYKDASMELARGKMTLNDGYSVEYYWCMIMKKFLQKGIKCLLQICHFNKIEE
jgi:hypothetical protein